VKFPKSSVVVPFTKTAPEAPFSSETLFTKTVTKEMGALFWSKTVPLILLCCPKIVAEKRKKKKLVAFIVLQKHLNFRKEKTKLCSRNRGLKS